MHGKSSNKKSKNKDNITDIQTEFTKLEGTFKERKEEYAESLEQLRE